MIQETRCVQNATQEVARQGFSVGFYLYHSWSKPFFHPQGQSYQGGWATLVRQDLKQDIFCRKTWRMRRCWRRKLAAFTF